VAGEPVELLGFRRAGCDRPSQTMDQLLTADGNADFQI